MRQWKQFAIEVKWKIQLNIGSMWMNFVETFWKVTISESCMRVGKLRPFDAHGFSTARSDVWYLTHMRQTCSGRVCIVTTIPTRLRCRPTIVVSMCVYRHKRYASKWKSILLVISGVTWHILLHWNTKLSKLTWKKNEKKEEYQHTTKPTKQKTCTKTTREKEWNQKSKTKKSRFVVEIVHIWKERRWKKRGTNIESKKRKVIYLKQDIR